MKIEMSLAARENVEETGVSPERDVERMRSGDVTFRELLSECYDGASPDRIRGWREYVEAIAAHASR